VRRAPGTNHGDGVLIAFGQFTPDIEHDGRSMDLAELAGIESRLGSDNLRTELADALQLRRQIHNGLPVHDLVSHVVANSIYPA
jgi:hypothetical protein